MLHFFIERYREAYDAEIDHFVDCVEKGTKPLAGFAEGREALRLADAALESSAPAAWFGSTSKAPPAHDGMI